MLKTITKFVLPVLVFLYAGCGEPSIIRENADEIAKIVATDVATVKQTFQGSVGAPILVIEESHSSRIIQLQEGIILNRLHNQYQVNQIGLEGFVRERSELKADWYENDTHGSKGAAQAVAVKLLGEGEYSSAEFMKLVYNDLTIVPIETGSEYNMPEPDNRMVYAVCLSYFYQIALRTLRPEYESQLVKLEQEAEKFKNNKIEYEKKLENMRKFIYKDPPDKISNDPWVKEKMLIFSKPESIINTSIEKEVSFYEEIQKHVNDNNLQTTPENKKIIQDFIAFLRGRMAASKTMVNAISPIADQPKVRAVVILIGAAHTDGICDLLKAAKRSFAVIRPTALDQTLDSSNIPFKMYSRKFEGKSIYSGGITDTLLEVFPSSSHHPPPVVQQRWFQAKSELYLFAERISKSLPGGSNQIPPNGGNGGGLPPSDSNDPLFNFGADDFNGVLVYIDSKKIEKLKNGNIVTALFPVELNRGDPSRHKIIWMQVGRTNKDEIPLSNENERVEKLLKQTLEDVSKEPKVPEKSIDPDQPSKLEDKHGLVKVTRETVAAIALTKEQAAKIPVMTL